MSPSEGTWIVTARFDHWKENTFTSQFQVKKYGRWSYYANQINISSPVFSECHIHCNVSFLVLPAFNVTLTPKKTFLSLDDSELVVEISARFVYYT